MACLNLLRQGIRPLSICRQKKVLPLPIRLLLRWITLQPQYGQLVVCGAAALAVGCISVSVIASFILLSRCLVCRAGPQVEVILAPGPGAPIIHEDDPCLVEYEEAGNWLIHNGLPSHFVRRGERQDNVVRLTRTRTQRNMRCDHLGVARRSVCHHDRLSSQ